MCDLEREVNTAFTYKQFVDPYTQELRKHNKSNELNEGIPQSAEACGIEYNSGTTKTIVGILAWR